MGRGLNGKQMPEKSLVGTLPQFMALAFLRHLQALGPGWGWAGLASPCWCTEQKSKPVLDGGWKGLLIRFPVHGAARVR